MKRYFRIMLGELSKYADDARKGNYIGAGFLPDLDLTDRLPEKWREFNEKFIPVFLKENPERSKIAAGLACGMLWTIAKGIAVGDIVLSPDGKGNYYIGEVSGEYEYHPKEALPHRRDVQWYSSTISKEDMTEPLRNSVGSIGTVSEVTKHSEVIEMLISGKRPSLIVATDESIEDPSVFALEQHLEDFLVQNWKNTELGKHYDIYEEDGAMKGQQYPSDTGPIDILAVRKDKRELLVIELKRGRASDVVVGQVQRYMGYVKEVLAEKEQSVRGVIIAFEDDLSISRALSVAPNIDFYTYKIQFRLEKKRG